MGARGGPSSKGKGVSGAKEDGRGVRPDRGGGLAGRRKGAGKTGSERAGGARDGLAEGAVSEADDMVLCVLHPGEEEGGRGADG